MKQRTAVGEVGPDETAAADINAARAEAEALVADGTISREELATDIPDPKGPAETFSFASNETKNKGGRPKSEIISAIVATGISRPDAFAAAKVAKLGTLDLQAAVARGDLSIRRAGKIAALPQADQASAID